MIVRVDYTDNRQAETSLPATGHSDAEYEDLARGLLVSLPGVSRVRVWVDGLSFLDVPTVDVRQTDAIPTQRPSDDILDVATALLLAEDDHDDQTPPSWLRRYPD